MPDRNGAAIRVEAVRRGPRNRRAGSGAPAGSPARRRRTPRGPPRLRSGRASGRRARVPSGSRRRGDAHERGSSAWVAEATTRARGSIPSSSAASPLARTIALAPSLSGEEFPRSSGSCSAGREARLASRRSCRRGSTRRARRSAASVFRVAGISTGWISLASRPESRAAAACWCERRAKRVDLLAGRARSLLATFCAVCIISM